MSNRYLITVSGLDMTNWIRENPVLPISKSGLGELTEIPNLTLIGDNTNHVWTPLHQNSIFDVGWRGSEIKVFKDNILSYEGEVRNSILSNDGRIANIQTTAKINRILNAQMPPYFEDLKTFAEHSQDIYEKQFGIEIDPVSYTRSREKQEDLAMQVRANIHVDAKQSILQVQQFLADAGMCRHYFISNIAYMDFVDPETERISLHEFSDNDILEISNYQLIEQDIHDGYEVITAAGTARKAGLNKVPIIDMQSDKSFVMASVAGGYNWGDRQILLSERQRYTITVFLAAGNYSSWLNLDSVITINSELFGFKKDFEIVSIDDSNLLGIIIIGESI